MMKRAGVVAGMMACAGMALAQQTSVWAGPQADTSVIDAQGTAHVQRVVPAPENLSPRAKKWVGKQVSDAEKKESVAEQRQGTDAWQTRAGAQAKDDINLERASVGWVWSCG